MQQNYEPYHNWQHQQDANEAKSLGCLVFLFYILILVVFFGIATLFAGCSPRVIENTVIQHDTTYVERVRRDSVSVHDSIYIKEWTKGDTVYISRDKWHTQWRDRLVRDTSYVAVHDTIHATEVREVEKRLSTWQSAQIWAGRLMISILIAALIYVAWKIYLRFSGRT